MWRFAGLGTVFVGDRLLRTLCGGIPGLRRLSGWLRALTWRSEPGSFTPNWPTDPALCDLTAINTLLYVGVGVNLKMFSGTSLLSGYFMSATAGIRIARPFWSFTCCPWAAVAGHSCASSSVHWMVVGQWRLHQRVSCPPLFGDIDGPIWLNSYLARDGGPTFSSRVASSEMDASSGP